MIKVLRACGDRRDGNHFNCCDQDEIVGIHGMVCCNDSACGCGRSFTGIESSRGTTTARVILVTEEQFEAACEKLHQNRLAAWGNSSAIAQEAVDSFRQVPELIADFGRGYVLEIKKTNYDVEIVDPQAALWV